VSPMPNPPRARAIRPTGMEVLLTKLYGMGYGA